MYADLFAFDYRIFRISIMNMQLFEYFYIEKDFCSPISNYPYNYLNISAMFMNAIVKLISALTV